MRIKTCEEYLINELEKMKKENKRLVDKIEIMNAEIADKERKLENNATKEELVNFILECDFLVGLGISVNKQKAFINEKCDIDKKEESEEI